MPNLPSWFNSFFGDLFEAFVVFFAIFLILYAFIARANEVSGSSMFPTMITGERLLTEMVSFRFQEPQRGQIIVLNSPAEPSRQLIKRLIGLPGETIVLRPDGVYINGAKLPEPYVNGVPDYSRSTFLKLDQEYVIPENSYIFMGDNRNASLDAREMGPVTRDNILGKAFFVFWPLNRIGLVKSANY